MHGNAPNARAQSALNLKGLSDGRVTLRGWLFGLCAVLILMLSGLMASSGALAQSSQSVLYGPKTVELSPQGNRLEVYGDIDVYSPGRTPVAPFTLVIDNLSSKTPPGKKTDIEIWHNLQKIADTNDLFTPSGQPIRTVSKNISVRPFLNIFVVKVQGKAPVRLSYKVVAGSAATTPAQITGISPNPLALANGSGGVLTATLSPAPSAAGTLVLSSANPAIATVPATVAFTAGQTSVAIPVQGTGIGSVAVTASLSGASGGPGGTGAFANSSATANVQVSPAPARIVEIIPTQKTLQEGASGQLEVRMAPPQTVPVTVTLISSNPTKVSVASSVNIAAGQTSAAFTAQAIALGNAQITASLTSGALVSSAAAQVQVVPVPVSVTALLPANNMLQKGGAATLTVKLSAAQSTPTTALLSARTTGIVNLPASVVIPAGLSQVTFELQGLEVGNTLIAATLNGSSAEAAVQVTPVPASISSISPPSTTLVVGANGQLLLALNAAQPSPTTITLTTDPSGLIQVPGEVIIAAGQIQASVAVTALAVGQADVVATLGGVSRRATIVVTPLPAAVADLVPNSLGLQQGASANFTVRLNAAQTAATVVSLSVADASLLRIPATVTVPAGQVSQTVSVQALLVGSTQVTAGLNGSVKQASVNITAPPPRIASLQPTTQDLPKGKIGQLTLTLDRAATAPAVITLSNSNSAALGLPAQVTVPAGQLSADIAMTALIIGQSNVAAALNGSTASANVNVIAPEIVGIAVTPATLSLTPGQSAQVQATGTYSDGTTQDVTSGASTAWSSASSAIASVSSEGRVTGNSQGVTSIQALQAVLPTSSNPAPNPVVGSTSATVGAPSPLGLSAAKSNLLTGESVVVSITSPYAAGANPIVVNLNTSGIGTLQAPASATINPGLTSVSITVRALSAGDVVLQASSTQFGTGQLGFTITNPVATSVAITGINPSTAAVGAIVTISGSGFASPAANNSVAFQGGAPAVVQSGTSVQLLVKVPDAAQTGPITVTNTLGSAQSSVFTVLREQDFGITASPAYLKVIQSSNAAAVLSLATSGTRAYQGLAKLSAQGLPAGVSATFEPPSLSAFQTGKVILQADAAAPLGSATVVIKAEASLDGLPWVRESRLNIEVVTKTNVTGVKGRFVTPSGQGIAGIIARQDITTNQVVTDAGGNFTLVGLPSGVTTLRFDATPANSLYPIWPYNVTLDANQILTMADWVINPPPTDDKFKTINNASQTQQITDERYPGFAVVLPAGATITGWDGVKKSRIAVERIDPDKLPVGAPPFPMREAYQLYFGTPMGGIPSQPIPVTLPNVAEKEPGEKAEIWWFDGSPMGGTGEWKMAGLGTVSPDGKTVASDPGVGLPRFCGVCGLVSLSCPPPPTPPQPPPMCPAPTAGNPVDLFTGQEMASTSGLSCGGLKPVETGMKYNPVDAFNNKAGTVASFGYGWTLDHDISFLPFSGPQKRLVMPGGKFVNMVDDGSGKYRPSDDPRFDGAYAQDIGGGKWQVSLKGGAKWQFEPFAGITGVIRGGPPLFVTKMIDNSGNETAISRQSNGRVQSISGSDGRGISFSYGGNGFVSRMSDHTGRSMQFSYVNTTDPDTKATGFRIKNIVDAQGRTTTYTYDNEIATPSPQWTTGNAGPWVQPANGASSGGGGGAAACDPSNCGVVPLMSVMTSACWDYPAQAKGVKLMAIQYPDSDTPTQNAYYASGRVKSQTASDGRRHGFSYRYRGACVQRIAGTGSARKLNVSGGANQVAPPPEPFNVYQYCMGRVAGVPATIPQHWAVSATPHQKLPDDACPVEENDETRAAGWEFVGGTLIETRVTKPDGNSTRTKFNPRGMPLETIDELGQSTRFSYDPNQRLVKSIDPLGRETKFEYDAVGNQTAQIDSLGRRLETTYDPLLSKPTAFTQFLLGVPSSQGGQQLSYSPVIRTMTYDAKGNVIAMADSLGHTSQVAYSAKGQISEIVLPANASASTVPVVSGGSTATVSKAARKLNLTYNSAGDIALMSDAQGFETRFATDSLGRTVGSTDPLGYSSQTQYNVLDQVTQIKNALGQDTQLNYDTAARLTGVVNPAGVTIEGYAYDSNGRLMRVTDAVNQSSTVVYDISSRPISVTDRKGQVTAISYDERGAISTISKPGQSISYQYDAVGRLTQVRDNTTVSTHQYDAVDRLTQIDTTTAAGSHRLQYQYDSLDRVTSRTLSGTGFAAPEVTSYIWDLADRLVSHTTSVGGQPHATSYQYDVAGRLTARKVQAGNQADLITQRYGYDSLERLAQIKYIKAEGQAGEQLIEQIDYGYDAAGRRTSKTALNNNGIGQGETPMTATYDAANRMTAITLSIAGATKSYTLSYDANGNLTQKQNTTEPTDKTLYTWDANDRLSQIAQTGATQATTLNASYTYDVFGRRIQSSISAGGNPAQTVQYLYEGSQALGEIRGGKLSHRLLTGLKLDETIARIAINSAGQKDAANSRIYLTDALNSVVAQLSDDNTSQGQLQNSYGYSPFGEAVTVGPDAANNPIQYTSREKDGTSLNFYRARYYDPVLKRFISEDPAGLAAGLNGYRYVDNAPTEYSDPDGELPIVPIAIAYGRCVAQCMAKAAVGEAIFGDISCFDVGDNAKDCALDCLNPFNWGGGKGLRNNIAGKVGTTYRVPGPATRSGKPYVGRHNGPDPATNRRSNDGRDRTQADITGTYDGWDSRGAGATAEQSKIDAAGGIGNLDNKINAKRRK